MRTHAHIHKSDPGKCGNKKKIKNPFSPNKLKNIQLTQMNQTWPYFQIPDAALTTFKCQTNFRGQPKPFSDSCKFPKYNYKFISPLLYTCTKLLEFNGEISLRLKKWTWKLGNKNTRYFQAVVILIIVTIP